jgi:hypothetical protein
LSEFILGFALERSNFNCACKFDHAISERFESSTLLQTSQGVALPVDIVLGVVGEVVVDDSRDSLDVQPA